MLALSISIAHSLALVAPMSATIGSYAFTNTPPPRVVEKSGTAI